MRNGRQTISTRRRRRTGKVMSKTRTMRTRNGRQNREGNVEDKNNEDEEKDIVD